MTAEAPAARVVVVGASAGGVLALKELVKGLPSDFPAAVVVVLHLSAAGPSVLPQILDREGPLPALVAEAGVDLVPGTIYVAPPDRHLELDGLTVRLTDAPPEHNHRPSIDRLFRTAAGSLGALVIGVVLSGALDDGAQGLAAIRRQGGDAVVQDPATAGYASMPQSALTAVPDAWRLPIAELAGGLVRLCDGAAGPAPR